LERVHERRDACNGFREELHSLAVDQVTGRIIGPMSGSVFLDESTWTVHDLDHVAQIYSSLAASRDLAVGPWKAYLGILLRRDAAGPAPGAGDAAAR
jgi:hypothetical protein